MLISVQDAASQTWPAPEVHDASGGPVTVWNPVADGQGNIANFVLRDSRLRIGDTVAPFWRLPGDVDQLLAWIPVSAAGEAQASVPPAVLAASRGRTVTVFYAVMQGGVVTPLSAVLTLRVADFAAGDLPAPVVAEASGTPAVLDLNITAGNATVIVAPWPLIAAGQTFWLLAKGIRDDGSIYTERLSTPYAVQPAEVATGIRRVLERPQLLRLENASTLRLELKVDLTGGAVEASATLFPEGEVVMATVNLDLIAPTVVGAVNGILDPDTIPGNGVVVQVPVFGGRAVSQWVSVVFNGQGGSKEVTDRQQVTDASDVMEFVVSKAEVLKSINQAVTFEYKVALTDGGLYTTSDPVSLEVGEGYPTQPGVIDFEDLPLGDLAGVTDLGPCTITAGRISNTYPGAPHITGKHFEKPERGDFTIIRMHIPTTRLKFGFSTPGTVYLSVGYEDGRYLQFPITGNSWREFAQANISNRIKDISFEAPGVLFRLDNITVG
ncbi:hypothetical protein IFT75_11900 [Pseudomonas sp. CFBP 8758]|nr:hypothetical protein [Pseudomonas sp. CFBP 8758]